MVIEPRFDHVDATAMASAGERRLSQDADAPIVGGGAIAGRSSPRAVRAETARRREHVGIHVRGRGKGEHRCSPPDIRPPSVHQRLESESLDVSRLTPPRRRLSAVFMFMMIERPR
jgi:hypothetical protein